MSEFKEGDICRIVDIGEKDLLFKKKHRFIGRKVKFLWHFKYLAPPFDKDGFANCLALIVDEFSTPEKIYWFNSKIFFYQVKLEVVKCLDWQEKTIHGTKVMTADNSQTLAEWRNKL